MEKEKRKLQELWSATPPNPTNVDKYLDYVPAAGYNIDASRVCVDTTGKRLLKRVKAGLKKAAGIDTWRPSQWARLPVQWFELLAEIWNCILDGGKMPESWTQVRVKLIPKYDGTTNKRPLGIAQLAWRTGMQDIVKQLAPWIDEWLDPAIASGPNRSIEDLLDRVLSDMEEGRISGCDYAGAKIDLSKCFDRCHYARSCRVLKALGLDTRVLEVIGKFYENLQIYVEADGAVAQTAISPTTMVMQGCPASVLMVIAEMSTWAKYVAKEAPGAKAGAYFDDRTIWAMRAGCTDAVNRAITASKKYDDDAGWLWNADKGQRFASDGEIQREMDYGSAPPVGDFKPYLELLGIKRNVSGDATVLRERAEKKAKRRLKRIRIACPDRTARDRLRRTNITRQVVLPALCWGGNGRLPPTISSTSGTGRSSALSTAISSGGRRRQRGRSLVPNAALSSS